MQCLVFLATSTMVKQPYTLFVILGRRKRQADINFFQLLANVSGGSVITTDKNNIGKAVNIITVSSICIVTNE